MPWTRLWSVVNCRSTPTSGDRNNVPVEAWAEAFITESVYSDDPDDAWWGAGENDVYLEIIGRTRAGLPSSVQREVRRAYGR